jgi:hypothetical protein
VPLRKLIGSSQARRPMARNFTSGQLVIYMTNWSGFFVEPFSQTVRKFLRVHFRLIPSIWSLELQVTSSVSLHRLGPGHFQSFLSPLKKLHTNRLSYRPKNAITSRGESRLYLCSRVARFFSVLDTKTGEKCSEWTQNVPKGHKISQMSLIYFKWSENT